MMRKILVTFAIAGFAWALLPLVFEAGVVDAPGKTASSYIENSPKDFAAANIVTAIVVSYRGFDTLGEVAVVTDSVEEVRSLAFVNGTRAVALDVLKQTGANAVGVADAVKALAAAGKAPDPAQFVPMAMYTELRDQVAALASASSQKSAAAIFFSISSILFEISSIKI